MGKGDHVFNNVVAKLTKAFEAGLAACFRSTRKSLREADVERLANEVIYRHDWMSKNMPRTWAALYHFKEHPELVALREKLQTASSVGGDVNTKAYSEACQGFEEAVVSFFEKLGRGRLLVEANLMLPEVRAVRRAFLKVTEAAEDPGAAQRLLEEHKERPRELQQVQAEIDQVRKSLEWAWGRCEYLFRMVTQELLGL